jgi:hypothetical protein
MKTTMILLLALASAPALAQEIPIAASVLEDSPNISQEGKRTCVVAYDRLQEELSKMNGALFRMETHRELGYDIRHQDRMGITVLMDQRTNAMQEGIRKAAYRGDGAFCNEQLQKALKVAKDIYDANIAYRKITAP